MAYEELIDRMSSHMGKADIADVLPDLHAGAAALVEAAQAITTLERERDTLAERLAESEAENTRWLLRFAEIREASGVGSLPMLSDLPAAIKGRIDTLAEALATIRDETDTDVPMNHRTHDRDGCLDMIHALTLKALGAPND